MPSTPDACAPTTSAPGPDIEPVIILTFPSIMRTPAVLTGDGVHSGINHLPGWVYDYGTRSRSDRPRPRAALYTVAGAHDLNALLDDMYSSAPFVEVLNLIRNQSLVDAAAARDLDVLVEAAVADLDKLWQDFRAGIQL